MARLSLPIIPTTLTAASLFLWGVVDTSHLGGVKFCELYLLNYYQTLGRPFRLCLFIRGTSRSN